MKFLLFMDAELVTSVNSFINLALWGDNDEAWQGKHYSRRCFNSNLRNNVHERRKNERDPKKFFMNKWQLHFEVGK